MKEKTYTVQHLPFSDNYFCILANPLCLEEQTLYIVIKSLVYLTISSISLPSNTGSFLHGRSKSVGVDILIT